MRSDEMNQMLRGAAVAALLILPTLAHAGPAAPPPPPASPAPMAMPAAVQLAEARAEAAQARAEARAGAAEARAEAAAAAADARAAARAVPYALRVAETGGWFKRPRTSYTGIHKVRVDDLVGTLTVVVKDGGPVLLDIAGIKSRVDDLDVGPSGDTLRIEGTHNNSVWDWHDWFNFSIHDRSQPGNLRVTLTVPRGTEMRVDGLVGDANIGDTMAPIRFEAAASNAVIGKVGRAKISLAGSGKIGIVEVAGPLDLDIAGSGKIRVGKSGSVKADVAGAGDARLGQINGGLKLDIAGSGDVTADSVNGPVKVSIAGSGSIKIAKGQADPLKVDIIGSGNFDFGGNAVNPSLSALGSGRVRLKSYTGHLSSNGSINVKVGDKSISINTDDDSDD
jgi:hypothetical protein